MFTSWSEACSLAVLPNLVPSVSVLQHRHSQVKSLNLWRNKSYVLLYTVFLLWGPIKGKVIKHNIQGHNSHMYDNPRYNQLTIIGIYTIDIYTKWLQIHILSISKQGPTRGKMSKFYHRRSWHWIPLFNFLFTYLFRNVNARTGTQIHMRSVARITP
jgi:hypothetical protein